MENLKKRLAERKITLELTEEAKTELAAEGFDPAYGARPLKRTIQRRIQDPLAMKILEGEFQDGDHIKVDAQNGEFVFEKMTEGVLV